ncbi:hypothetical protein B5C06_12245 [Staphylococcus delphini]|nr:hypothetical protein B5C06_12245 [Staphylococcus delphini]
MTKAILDQYSEDYNIRIFQGFSSVIAENGELDAISLGRINAELQPQIDEQRKKYEQLRADVTKNGENIDNIYAKYEEAQEALDQFNKTIERFYIKAASQLKRQHVTWTGANYNKRNFEVDIEFACALSNEKLAEYRRDEAQTIIENTNEQIITVPKIKGFLASVNDIITQNITQSALLKFKTNDEMNWVKEGLHYHQVGETCAFCGSEVQPSRLDDLNTYFNNEVKILEERIAGGITMIESVEKEVDEIRTIDKTEFYAKFHEEIANLNVKILNAKNEYYGFLENLRQALIIRNQNIFVPLKELSLTVPSTFDGIIEQNEVLHQNNQTYSDNLSKVKQSARKKLKYHEIFKKLERFNYNEKLEHLNLLENDKIIKKKLLEDKEKKAEEAKAELEALLLQTVDESQAAKNINELLKKLGNRSFKLESVKSDAQKGQY